MLRRFEDLRGFNLRATDGDIGQISDLYFGDDDWQVCYIIVDTGSWLLGRKVLISPHVAHPPLWEERVLPVDLTKDQVENSPDIDLNQPVSRQHQVALHSYYGWPAYWAGGAVLGPTGAMPLDYPATGTGFASEQTYIVDDTMPASEDAMTDVEADPHLRSAKEVIGYHIKATDGEIGHIEDFFVSETEWNIQYAMVDTRNWLPGRKVLILPEHIREIDWQDSRVFVDLTRDQVKESPEFDPRGSLDRTYETTFYDYYEHPYYWL
jgi:hypothetical protein